MFSFSRHPAYITVSDGIQDAFKYLQLTWRKWLPAVAAMALFAILTHVAGGSFYDGSWYHTNPYTGVTTLTPDAAQKVVGTMVAGVIASWIYNAAAISGLRGRPLTVGFVVSRGLISILTGLILAFAFVAAVVVLIIAAVATRGVGVLALFLLIPLAVYIGIRVVFSTLAVFDGFGPIDAISESWRLSKGSVLRMFGWGVLAALMLFGFTILGGIVASVFGTSSGLAGIGQGASALVSGAGSVLMVYMMAVLYESERSRKDPLLYPIPPMMGYGPYGPQAYGPQPYGPGPSGWPGAVVPAAGYGAPANSTAIPGWAPPQQQQTGWVAPQPPAWPGYPPYPPQSGWVAPQAPPPAPGWPGYPQNPQQGGWVAPQPPSWPSYPATPPEAAPVTPVAPAWTPADPHAAESTASSPDASRLPESQDAGTPPEAPAS